MLFGIEVEARMTREEFKRACLAEGWKEDRYGHLQKEMDGRQYRMKLSPIMARYELKTQSAGWVRITSGYYAKLAVYYEAFPDGSTTARVSGMKPWLMDSFSQWERYRE